MDDDWQAYNFTEGDRSLLYKGVFWGCGIKDAIETFTEANDELSTLDDGRWEISEDETSAVFTYVDEDCEPGDRYTAVKVGVKPDHKAHGPVRYEDDYPRDYELGATCSDCYMPVFVLPPKRIRDLMDREDAYLFEDKIYGYTDNHNFYCPNCQKTGEQGAVE